LRLERGFAEMVDGLCKVAAIGESDGDVVVGFGRMSLDAQGFGIRERWLCPSALV